MLRRLTTYLIISGIANVVLLTLLIYWMIRDRPPTPYYELKPANPQEQQPPLALDLTKVQILRYFRTLSKEQLLAKLSDAQMVEDGYAQRDLALACLVHYHYFDLSRALGEEISKEKARQLSYSRKKGGAAIQIIIYPGLSDAQFQKAIAFANTEKWPLTSQGLFWHVRQRVIKKESLEPTLADAFYLTPEFLAVEMLFTRSGVSVDRTELVQTLGESEWEILSKFTEKQRVHQDLTPARRQKLLLDYVESGNRAAAYLLLKTDYSFVARKLDDGNIMKIMNLLVDKTPEAEKFVQALLRSPRSDAVWKAASQKLQDFTGQNLPDKILPPIKPPKKNLPFQTMRTHIVKEGDSLWKISRLYKVEMDDIKKTNSLSSDFLKPGITLKIPEAK